MAVTVQSSDLIDPLHDHSEISLLPRTFEGLKSKKDSLQSVMKALAVNSPSNLPEQAKMVLNNSSELRTQDMQAAYMDNPAGVNIRPQERRPALGRKRARFSLRPSTSQSTVVGGMSLDIDELQDPEEFFLAFENHERAEKELQRLRGDAPTDLTRHIPTTAARSRRPGISGRRASHGQRFSSLVAKLDETIGPSGKLSEVDSPTPSNTTYDLATTDAHEASKEKELAGNEVMVATQDSVAEEKNKVGVLDELLSQDGPNLDGDEAVKYFQDRLQIKTFNFEKLCLPEVDGVRRSEGEVSLKQLPRPMKALSSVYNVSKRIKSTEYFGPQQLVKSPNISPKSPTPLRSPFPSRHLSKGARLDNPLLSPGVEIISPTRDSSHDEGIDRGAPLLHDDSNSEAVEVNGNELSLITAKQPADANVAAADSVHSVDLKDDNGTDDGAHSLNEDREDPVDTFMDLDEPVPDGSAVLPDPMLDNLHKSSKGVDLSSHGLTDGFEDTQGIESMSSKQADHSCEGSMVKNLHKSGNQLGTSGPTENDHHAIGQLQTAVAFPGDNNQESPGESVSVRNKRKGSSHNGRGQPVPRKGIAGVLLNVGSKQKASPVRTTQRRSLRKSLEGTSGPTENDHHAIGQLQTAVASPGDNIQEAPGESVSVHDKQEDSSHNGRGQPVPRKSIPEELSNVGSKRKARLVRTRRRRSLRKSLEGAGTLWQSGQRKSSRIRMRPLEFWKGERFLYGRVHESLLTVVACKYTSPANADAKSKLKVQSYVADNYKDLVGKVANDGIPAVGL